MRYRRSPGREGIGDEALRRELGAVQVAACQAGAADVELAGDADRHRLERESRTWQRALAIGRPIGMLDGRRGMS